MRSVFLIVFLVAINLTTFGQNENNNWNFGNGSSVSFTTGKPVVKLNSKLYTDEGCASVSDLSGNLLFYTDGVTIWDNTNNVMLNGENLFGHKSSTSSAVIVPHPSNENLYYVFTSTEKGGYHGLRYSIVDVSKNNSKGQVITKNVMMLTPVSEKITVAKHKNGKDFWVITHKWNSSEFCSFLLSENGVQKAPVISKIGTDHRDVQSGNKGESIGQIKVSPNQKKIAVAITYKQNQPVEIFDFDNSNGKISNLFEIPTSGYAYGLEFSPNNSKLYVSFLKGNYGVIQYDLEASDIFEDGIIALSKPKGYENYGSLQIGPDNKIYVAKTGRYLDVINYPDKKGAQCGYKLGGINLRDKTCVYGLPPLVPSRKVKTEEIGRVADVNKEVSEIKSNYEPKGIVYEPKEINEKSFLCTDFVKLDAGKADRVYLWSTGETSKEIKVTKPGTYNVILSHPNNISSETQSFVVTSGHPKVNLGTDTILNCVGSYELNAKNKGYVYKWSTGSKKQSITVYETGTYIVTVTNGRCTDVDTVKVEFGDLPASFKALTNFSPMNTSFNSFFDYSVKGIREFELVIRNEKGRKVFSTTDPRVKWTGINKKRQVEEPGFYFWKVKYRGPCTDGIFIEEEGKVKLY